MYERFFNLKKKPFEIVPNPDFLYLSGSHKKALGFIMHGIRERSGFMLLVGEVGSGKTTLIRQLIKKVNRNVTLSKVFNTRVNSEQLIALINEDFGLDSTGKDKVRLLKELNDFLIKEYEQGRQAVLIIDEAQNLEAELLEEIRLLSNLETDYSKLLQIVLVGQPELKRTLSLPELRQLRQRINIVCKIFPLTRKETEEYIYHRLEIAGNKAAINFCSEAFDILYDATNGIPRLINKVCDFVMLTAFTEETREATPEMVRDIVDDLELKKSDVLPEKATVDGKRALLNALLDGVTTDSITTSKQPMKSVSAAQETKTELKEMRLRLDAIEKKYTKLQSKSIVDSGLHRDAAENLHHDFSESFLEDDNGRIIAYRATTANKNKEPRMPERPPWFRRLIKFE